MKASAVLLSWRRPENLPALVAALRGSAAVGEVLVWNNNQAVPLALEGAEVIHAPTNLLLLPRLALGCLARWSSVLFVDDDLLLTPAQVDRLWASYLADGARRVFGAQGRQLRAGRYEAANVFGPCDIVNQAVLAPRAALARALTFLPSPFWQPGTFDAAEDDILLCLAQELGQAVAVDLGPLLRCGAYDEAAWSRRPDHAARRQGMVDWMLGRLTAREPQGGA